MTLIGKCPRCKHYSLKEINEREFAGISKFGKHVLNRIHSGTHCPLCRYHNCKSEIR